MEQRKEQRYEKIYEPAGDTVRGTSEGCPTCRLAAAGAWQRPKCVAIEVGRKVSLACCEQAGKPEAFLLVRAAD